MTEETVNVPAKEVSAPKARITRKEKAAWKVALDEAASDRHARVARQPRTAGRVPLALSWGSRFTIPDEVKDADPDYIYGFVPDRSEGDEDSLDRAVSFGWIPVRMEDNPMLAERYQSMTVRKKEDPFLRKGGQVMARIHKDDYAAMQKRFDDQTRLQEAEAKRALEYQDFLSQNPLYNSTGVNFNG